MANLKSLPVPFSIEDKDLRDWLEQFQRNVVEMSSMLGQFDILHAVPERPRRGLVVYADGTSWNPGSGEGVYRYNGTIWVFLG